MTNSLVIVRRQSPDWGNMSKEAFRAQSRRFCAMAGLPIEQVNMTVDLWDTTFKQTYCSVRQALKDIAIENLQAVDRADLTTLEVLAESDVTDKRQYLFIDDDDWLCPNIVQNLPADLEDGMDGVVWGSVAFGTHKKQTLQARAIDGFCYTNNYTVKGKVITQSRERGMSPAQHWDADAILKGRSLIVEKYLSATNKSPASTCYLMHVLQGSYDNRRLLQDAIEEYLVRCRSYRSQLPPAMDWMSPLIDKTLDVFNSL